MKYSLLVPFLCMTLASMAQSLEPVIQSEYTPKPETAEGHPYLFEDYQPGSLIVNSIPTNANIRYNVAENFLLVNVEGREYLVKKEIVSGFVIQGKKKIYQFDAMNFGDKIYFVEVLYGEEDIKFGRWHRKIFTKANTGGADAYNAATTLERFEDISKYILLVDGKINEFSRKKDDLLMILSGGDEAMKSFLTSTMKEKKLKASNDEDVIALLKARGEYKRRNS